MAETHWKKLVDTNYLGSWDIVGGRLVLQIAKIKQERIFNQNKNAEELCTVAYFSDERYKPTILNKTNCKTMQKLTGSPYIEKWSAERALRLRPKRLRHLVSWWTRCASARPRRKRSRKRRRLPPRRRQAPNQNRTNARTVARS